MGFDLQYDVTTTQTSWLNRMFPAGCVVVVVLVGALLAGCSNAEEPLPVLWDAPAFSLTNQRGDTLTATDLHGKVWVTNFIFTHCVDACPAVLIPKMRAMQQELEQEGLLGERVVLVSFSVDPARDTPAVLQDYADRVGAIPGGWHFLTGSEDAIRSAIVDGFLVGFEKAAVESDHAHDGDHDQEQHHHHEHYDVMHSNRFMLVDQSGQIRHQEDGWDLEVDEFLNLVQKLTKE